MNPYQSYLSSVQKPQSNYDYGATGTSSYSPASAPKMSVYTPPTSTPANSSATSPKITSPAGKAYVQSQAPTTPSAPVQNTPTTPPPFGNSLGVNLPPSTGNDTSGTPTNGTTDARTAYVQYLKSLQDKLTSSSSVPTDTTAAQQALDKQNQNEAQATEDLSGQGRGIPLEILARQGTKIARDSALQKTALSQNLLTLQNRDSANQTAAENAVKNAQPLQFGNDYVDPITGQTIYSAPAANFSLGQGQNEYDATGKLIASGTPKDPNTSVVDVGGNKVLINTDTGATIKNLGSSTATGGTATPYVAGADPTVDAWVSNINSGKAKLSDLTGNPTLKNEVSQGLSQSGSSADDLLTTAASSLQDLNDMVTNDQGFTSAVGAKGLSSFFGLKSTPIAGTQAANFDAKLNQVKNDVILPNLSLLHGLGRVTDREFQSLTSAITSLGTNLSEDEFKKELGTITDTINQKISEGSSSSDSVTDPTGTVHTFPDAASAAAYKKAIGQ